MPPIKRRTFLKGTGAAAAVATLPSVLQNNPSAQSKPNVVFILADDMGYGDVSYLNENSKIATPNIDRIGQEGDSLLMHILLLLYAHQLDMEF